MSDVFTNLCLFGKEKKKNSVSNQITVVGVKKALLIGMYLSISSGWKSMLVKNLGPCFYV